MGQPRPYLAKPEPGRSSWWIWAISVIGARLSWLVADREPWIGPLFVLLGAAVGAQGVDAARTGRLVGWLPNRWPIDLVRHEAPKMFWLMALTYLALGAMWVTIGLDATIDWIRRTA
jgi:hypothetical protein